MSEYIINSEDYVLGMATIPYLREEIVRCRDCKHSNEVMWPANYQVPPDYLDCGGPLVETWDYYNDQPKDNPVPPNGFCFHGERRDDE